MPSDAPAGDPPMAAPPPLPGDTLPPGSPPPAGDGAPAAGPENEPPWARGLPFLPNEDPGDPRTWIWDLDLPLIAPYSWGEWSTLVSARNEKILELGLSRLAGVPRTIDNRLRVAWLESIPAPGGLTRRDEIATDPATLVLGKDDARTSARFLLIGDPGEGDISQWTLRRPLRARGAACDFAVIVSDVIYPAGEALYYRDRFHGTLRELELPVYAIPGNHDWDDGSLASFMVQFVEGVPDPGAEVAGAPNPVLPPAVREELAGVRLGLWRDASRGEERAYARMVGMRDLRNNGLMGLAGGGYPLQQRAPYFAIDAAGVLVIGLDQGFDPKMPIDEVQTRWLLDLLASHPDTPKVLLPGKPFANRGRLRGARMRLAPGVFPVDTLEELVALDGNVHRFIAVIGGDVHNYQHYTPTPAWGGEAAGGDPLVPHLIVAGGSGAYMAGIVEEGSDDGWVADELMGADPVLYPTTEQSRWYLRTQVQERVREAPVTLGMASLVAMLVLAGTSFYAALDPLPFIDSSGLLVLWWFLGLCGAGAAILWVRANAAAPPGGSAGGRWVLGAVALLLLGLGAGLQGILGLLARDAIAHAAGVLSVGVGLALVVGTFLPFGVLAQAFPVPSQRPGTALIGAGALTWLLVLAYPGAAGAGIVPEHVAMEAATLVAPTLLVVVAYLPLRRRGGDLALAVLVVANLTVLGLVLWACWGPEAALGAAAASAGLVFGALLGRGMLGPEGTGGSILVVGALGAALLTWAAVAGAGDVSPQILSSATLLAIVGALVVGNLAFIAFRLVVPRFTELLVGWLARPGADPWSLFERARPPFFKSFLEVEVTRGESVRIRCWGVSGFECDADDPIEVDDIEIPWPEPPPG